MSSQLVLSVFHGADLLGRGFDAEGFIVVRAAEIDLGFDVRRLSLPSGKFDGLIAGTPCQDFSLANRTKRTYEGNGKAMLEEFCRLVTEAEPGWFVLENVPSVPDIAIEGYTIQRFDLNANECGLKQNRLRHFQFGSIDGLSLILFRSSVTDAAEPCLTVAEGQKDKGRRTFRRFCELQGLSPDFDLPYFRLSQKYKVIGQAVPVPMARIVAIAVREALAGYLPPPRHRPCICNCGRLVTGKAKAALPACRKRIERRKISLDPSQIFYPAVSQIFYDRSVTDFKPGTVTDF